MSNRLKTARLLNNQNNTVYDRLISRVGTDTSTKWISLDQAEHLIDLVVKECVKVCADRGTDHDGLYSAWAEDCSKRIEKHFGKL